MGTWDGEDGDLDAGLSMYSFYHVVYFFGCLFLHFCNEDLGEKKESITLII